MKLKALRYTIYRDVLYHTGRDRVMRKCVTKGEVQDIIKEQHDSLWGGHFGSAITIQRILRTLWWPTFAKDVRAHVALCKNCWIQGKKLAHKG